MNNIDHLHTPEAIRERLAASKSGNYLGDFVLGAIDGCVTTFAVVAGVAGADLPVGVAVILGLANLVSDGFSMAAANYQKAKSDRDFVEKVRKIEEAHIMNYPDGEREEISQIFSNKGFTGPTLDKIVDVITTDRKVWVDTMVMEEYGLPLETPQPFKSALATFLAFCLVGLVPLIPFLIPYHYFVQNNFLISIFFTAIAFFAVGMGKGHILHKSPWVSGLETLLVGGAASTFSYVIGFLLKRWAGA